MAGIWLAAAPVAIECAHNSAPRATVRLVATGSTIANHPDGRLTADELANLIPAVEHLRRGRDRAVREPAEQLAHGRRVRFRYAIGS